ncbi:hypothetical protein H310_09427, partial [Aphanomyces invadans]
MFGRVRRAALLVLGILHPSSANAHGTHITSFEDVLSAQPSAQDYSVVNYVSIEPRDGHESFAPDAPFPPSLHIHIRTSNHIDLQFDVNLKRDLFAPDTFVWAHEGPELALLKSHKPHHIAYEGKLPQGYIRLTMFEAHKFHATVKLHDKIVVVDPVEQHKVAHQLDSPVTGLVAYTMPLAAATLSEDHHHRHLTTTYGRMTACTWTARQITVGVASDAGFTSEHGGAAQTQSYLIAVYNSINGLYDDQVGVHLTIGAFLIQTAPGGAAWNVEPQTCGPMVDMNIQLNAVKSWVAGGGIPLCNQENCGLWHVHTNCDADRTRTGNTAGLAWVGTLCSSTMGYNTGVSIDAGAMTWVIVGHEIGHNFGADHTFAEGGIMSYDWNSPVKFYDNGQVCAFVQSVLDKCLKPYTSDGAATTLSPTTTTAATPGTSTPQPTSSTPRPSTTPAPTAQPTTTSRPTSTVRPTATTPSPTTTFRPSTTTPPTTTPSWDPCACSTENMCRELVRPGCQTFLDKRYCYVVGYEQCARAKPSATCTNADGKTLYYLEFDGECPLQPPIEHPPATSTQSPPTTIFTTTASPTTTRVAPTTVTSAPTTTTQSPTTTPTLVSASPTPSTSIAVETTTSLPHTTSPSTTPVPTATSTSPLPTTLAPSDPCSCSTDSKCPTIGGGGCQTFHGRSWCYVKDPSKCVGAAFYDSVDCAGQKYMQCDPSTNSSLPSPPKDPCACSTTLKCPDVSSQPGCFLADRASYCFVEDPTTCFGPSVRSSLVCPRQKLRRCSSHETSASHWVVSEWSKCSKACGGGVKVRTASCMDEKESMVLPNASCATPAPVDSILCNIRSCPVTAFNNTTPCIGPPHSTCQPRAHKRLCDCACNVGYVYHRHRRECVPLPAVEFHKLKCPECTGDVHGPESFEVRSHDIDELNPTVCNGQEDGTTAMSASWLAAFEPESTATTSKSSTEATNIAMIAIATCIAAIALVLVVLAYRRRNALQPTTQIQTPVYIVGSTPGALL